MIGRESFLGSAGSFRGNSEDSIMGVPAADVAGRSSCDEFDILAPPAELDGRDWDKKSGLGLSKKKDLILFRLLLVLLLLCSETESLWSRGLALEVGISGGGSDGGAGIGIDACFVT